MKLISLSDNLIRALIDRDSGFVSRSCTMFSQKKIDYDNKIISESKYDLYEVGILYDEIMWTYDIKSEVWRCINKELL